MPSTKLMRPCWRAGGDGGEVAGATLELVGRQQGREGSEGRRTAMREEGGRQVGGRETEADFEGGVLQWPKGLSWYVAALHRARERERVRDELGKLGRHCWNRKGAGIEGQGEEGH